MRQLITAIAILAFSHIALAQIEMPFYGYDGGGLMIKKDSTGWFFYATNDSSKIVFIGSNRATYKLFDRKYKLLVDGDLGGRSYPDYFKRNGLWTEYFDNGKIKATGNYYEDHPIGLWQLYYPNGQLKETYSYTLVEADSSSNYCWVGSYQSFFENGQIEVNGFYKASIDTIDTIEMVDPVSGSTEIVHVRHPTSKKFGFWSYYDKNGNLVKKEEIRDAYDPMH